MFFDEEDLDEEIAGYLATAGTKEREDYLEGLDLLKRRFSSGLSSGMQNGGGDDDANNILTYYSEIEGNKGTNVGKRMLDQVLNFATGKRISLESNAKPIIVRTGSSAPSGTSVPTDSSTCAYSKKDQIKTAVESIKNTSKLEYEIGYKYGENTSRQFLDLLKTSPASLATESADNTYKYKFAKEITIIENYVKFKNTQSDQRLTGNSSNLFFQFIPIPGNGNCLFNAFAWWILQYNAYSTSSPFPDDFQFIMNKYTANPPNYSDIYTLAPSLRALVCGFHAGYTEHYEEAKELYYKPNKPPLINSPKNIKLEAMFIEYDTPRQERLDEPLEHCENAAYSGIREATVLALLLNFNYHILGIENLNAYLISYYCETPDDRPTMIILRQGSHWDVLYPKNPVLTQRLSGILGVNQNEKVELSKIINPLTNNVDHLNAISAEAQKAIEEWRFSVVENTMSQEDINKIPDFGVSP